MIYTIGRRPIYIHLNIFLFVLESLLVRGQDSVDNTSDRTMKDTGVQAIGSIRCPSKDIGGKVSEFTFPI